MTFTPGSLRMPKSAASVFCLMSSRTLSALRLRAFRHARHLEFRVAKADVRVKPAAGGGDGVGGNGVGFFQVILGAIGGDAIFERVVQFWDVGPRFAAAGIGGVVAIAGGGWTRMEVFRLGEILAEQFRAANGAVLRCDQAAVGFMRKRDLGDAVNHEWIKPAADEGETMVAMMALRSSVRSVFIVFG